MKRFIFISLAMFFLASISVSAQAPFDSTSYGVRDGRMFVSQAMVSSAGGQTVSFAGDPTNWQLRQGKLENGFFFCPADSNYVFPEDRGVVFYCAVDNGKFIPDSIRNNLANKTDAIDNGQGGYNFLIKPEMIGRSGYFFIGTDGAIANPDPGTTDFSIWRFITGSVYQDIDFEKLKFSIDGTIGVADLVNFSLWCDGTKISSTVDSMAIDKTVTFNFAVPFRIGQGFTKTFYLKADIGKGTAGKTYRVSFRHQEDIVAKDVRYGVYVAPNAGEVWKEVSASSFTTINREIGVRNEEPKIFHLFPNYPNPFNPATNIRFTTSEPGKVSLEIWNITGQKVEEITSGFMEAGEYSFIWDASRFSTGIYFCQVKSGNRFETIKMMLMK